MKNWIKLEKKKMGDVHDPAARSKAARIVSCLADAGIPVSVEQVIAVMVGCGVANWWNAEIVWDPCVAAGVIGTSTPWGFCNILYCLRNS